MATFADIVRSRADDDSMGLRFEAQEWSWSEVVQECADRAAALTARWPVPVGRQRHIGVLLQNVPDYVFWLGAAALTGSVLVGINPSRRGAELADDISHADCDLIVTDAERRPLLSEIGHGVPVTQIVDIDSPAYGQGLAAYRGAALPETVPAEEHLCLLLFSSGSTGAPKAVKMSQGRLGGFARAAVDRIELTPASVTYLCMPLFHGNALMMNLVPAMAVGATVAMVRKFSASSFSNDLHRYQATYVNYVGRALSYVLMSAPDPRDAASSLQLAFGTEASETDAADFAARFSCRVMEGYGMSEGVFRIARTPDTPSGALGRAVGDADVRVLAETTGLECPRTGFDVVGRLTRPDAIGQIVAVGMADRFEGYYKNPEAEAMRTRGSDFWTGDLGYRDTDGYFYFAGRSSDWLRVDSENFSAAPVERILQRFPAVTGAVVYAVPDSRTGDQVMCALEVSSPTEFDADEFTTFLDQQPDLSTTWRPRLVRVTRQLPSTASGKVDKSPLRRDAWNTLDPVWVRDRRSIAYRLLEQGQRDLIEDEFRTHGRSALLPLSVLRLA